MKRRSFLKGALGAIATSSGLSRVAVAGPCAPPLVGAPNPQCGVPPASLSETAAGLAPGQSAQFTKNTLQRQEDIQWQLQTIWYDAPRGELQYMGKPASSQSQNHSHYIYTEATDSWSTTGQSLFPGFGHIWNVTFDPINGDYWFRPYNSNSLRWYDRSASTWKETVSQTSPALNSGNASFAAMGWHPNLFGPGEPGIFIWAVFRFFAYNLSTQSFSVLTPSNFSSSSPYYDRKNGQALYLPGSDQLICFADDRGNGHSAVIVEAGAGNSSNVVSAGLVSTTSAPPILVYGGGGTANHGHVVHHPNDANRLLLLDEHGSSRVWQSTNSGASWQQQSYTHPFQAMNNWSAGEYTVGTIAPYGVIVGMTSNSSGGETVLWKPPQ